MTLPELREFIEEARQSAANDKQIIIATRAGEALENGIRIIEAFRSLGECPDLDGDFRGWNNWWSSYNRLVNQRIRCDGILSLCLEVMGFEYNEVQNVITNAAYSYKSEL